ncbi:MAG: hypothetical protein ACNI25_10655 [Halarcobacter sp.]
MEKFINKKYHYYDHWWQDDKKPQDKLTLEEAQRRFNDKKPTGNTFYILVGEDETDPKYIINYVSMDLISVYKLNDNFDDIVQISYIIMHNLDDNKLYLNQFHFNKYDGINAISNNLIIWSFIKNYNNGNPIWEVLEKQRNEYLVFANNKEEYSDITFTINGNEQWREYPKFGNWDWMIEDLEFLLNKYEEMKNE